VRWSRSLLLLAYPSPARSDCQPREHGRSLGYLQKGIAARNTDIAVMQLQERTIPPTSLDSRFSHAERSWLAVRAKVMAARPSPKAAPAVSPTTGLPSKKRPTASI
jgi:hypothetical protein